MDIQDGKAKGGRSTYGGGDGGLINETSNYKVNLTRGELAEIASQVLLQQEAIKKNTIDNSLEGIVDLFPEDSSSESDVNNVGGPVYRPN